MHFRKASVMLQTALWSKPLAHNKLDSCFSSMVGRNAMATTEALTVSAFQQDLANGRA